jgi:hypothetical protein
MPSELGRCGFHTRMFPGSKGTRSVKTIATRRRRVVIGDDDPSPTRHAGLALVAELDRVLGIAPAIDAAVGPIKARRQGLGAGGLVLAAAEMMLAGGDFMADLDVQRDDTAGRALRAVPEIPSSPTFIGLTQRFDAAVFAGIEAANARLVARWFAAWIPCGEQRWRVCARRWISTPPTLRSTAGRRNRRPTTMPVSSSAGPTPRSGPKPAS